MAGGQGPAPRAQRSSKRKHLVADGPATADGSPAADDAAPKRPRQPDGDEAIAQGEAALPPLAGGGSSSDDQPGSGACAADTASPPPVEEEEREPGAAAGAAGGEGTAAATAERSRPGSPIDVDLAAPEDAAAQGADAVPLEAGADAEAEAGAAAAGGDEAGDGAAPAAEQDAAAAARASALRAALEVRVEPPPVGPAWDALPDWVGPGARARLLALARLHLPRAGAPRAPAAVRALPANANRVLLAAPEHCGAYLERVVRALAGAAGARLLVVDDAALGLEPADDDGRAGGGAAGGDAADAAALDGVYAGAGVFDLPSDESDGFDEFAPPGLGLGLGGLGPPPRARASGFAAARAGGVPLPGRLRPRDPRSPGGGAPEEGAANAAAAAAATVEEPGLDPWAGDGGADGGVAEARARLEACKAAAAADDDDGKAGAADAVKAAGGAAAALPAARKTAAAAGEASHAAEAFVSDVSAADAGAPPAAPPPAAAADARAAPTDAPAPLAAYEAALPEWLPEVDRRGAAAMLRHLDSPPRSEADPAAAARALATLARPGSRAAGQLAALRSRACGVLASSSAAAALPPAELDALRAWLGATSAAAVPGAVPPSPVGARRGAPAALRLGARVSFVGRALPGGAGGAGRPADAAARLDRALAGGADRLRALKAAMARLEGPASGGLGGGARRAPAGGALPTAAERGARYSPPYCPRVGARGRVVAAAPGGGAVEVLMDAPYAAAAGIVRRTFTCAPAELAPAAPGRAPPPEPLGAAIGALVAAAGAAAAEGPVLVFVKDIARLVAAAPAGGSAAATGSGAYASGIGAGEPGFYPDGAPWERDARAARLAALRAALAPPGGGAAGALPDGVLLVGGMTTRALNRAPGGGAGGRGGGGAASMSSMLFGGGPPGGDGPDAEMAPWLDTLRGRLSRAGRPPGGAAGGLRRVLPAHVELHPPHADADAKRWKKMIEADVAAEREAANRAAVGAALRRCGVGCADLGALVVADALLARPEVEQVVGAALAAALAEDPAAAAGQQQQETTATAAPVGAAAVDAKAAVPAAEDAPPAAAAAAEPGDAAPAAAVAVAAAAAAAPPLVTVRVTAAHLSAAAAAVAAARAEAAPTAAERPSLRDLAVDGYEKQLLGEVIPPDEIAVRFGDIGALEATKTALHEVVILPLARPELFARGALARPTRGLLLFGPPGTGKTMLAKAIAHESGAHFINVNLSALTSKWFGEAERLVRALFSLAHKLAPSVVFVDEIDSFLSRRGGGGGSEHEAFRKMKNEFMSHWDGLRTSASDRVLVLAATNRPMDLDEAAVRRLPRRILVPLPDAGAREKILRVLLRGEALEPGFDVAAAAAATDGYSGSDLRNLAVAAAMAPIRELLEAEKAAKKAAGEGAGGGAAAVAAAAAASPPAAPELRPIRLDDFTAAMRQVTPSTHADTASMDELRRWDAQFGEGGTRRHDPLPYFT